MKKTLRLPVDPHRLGAVNSQIAMTRAAEILVGGGLVALPTETVYGIGANALSALSVQQIYEVKQRPAWDPVIVHIAGPVEGNLMLGQLVKDLSSAAEALIRAFWPGPLTLLLPRSEAVPDIVTAGRPMVGIRMPAHPVAFEVILRAGVPVAAPSANVFGHISPTTADHVLEDLAGRIDAVVDAGPTQFGLESTVLDPNRVPMVVYRPGAITVEHIRAVAGPVEIFVEGNLPPETGREGLPSPGVGLRHYAPRARLILVEGTLSDLEFRLAQAARPLERHRLGLMLPTELNHTDLGAPLRVAAQFLWGSWTSPDVLAEKLYAGLRALDAQGCDVILCPLPQAGGIGDAIRDRLRKAAFRDT